MVVIRCAEAEQQSDAEETTANESQLDTSAYQSADDVQPAPEAKSPVVESVEPPAPKVASPIRQVTLCVICCIRYCLWHSSW